MAGMFPDLASYDIVLLNTSGGKDSQVMIDEVVRIAKEQGVPLHGLVAVHCDLGRVEWQGTRELAERQARHYGLRFEVVSRNGGDLLEHIEQRGMFPSSAARYCTSDHKRAQVCRVMTALVDEIGRRYGRVRVLNCMGLRAQESPARAKRQAFISDDPIYSNKTKRQVDTWLPLHTWTEADVWGRISQTGVEHHRAYDLGMPRLSCCFCIFAPREALMIAGEHNPELLAEYVRVEQKIGHTLRVDQSLTQIQTALAGGERGSRQGIRWMACA